MSITSKENRAYLKRAWLHLIGTGLGRNKKSAGIIFATGFLTTIIQVVTVLLLVGAARAYDADGILSYGKFSIDLSSSPESSRLLYACITGTMLVTSILVGVGHKLIVTRIGRRFYQNLLDDTRLRLVSAVKDGRSFDRTSYLQYLGRDCRYLSLSYIRVMNLIQPALLLISVFLISFFIVPIAAMFLAIAGIVVLPLNIYFFLWVTRTSQDIQKSAKLKGQEEAKFINDVSSNPFIAEIKTEELIDPNRPGEQGFLSAFVNRQRMSAYSQSITDLMMALVIIALAAFLFFGGGNTLLLKLSSLVILVILFRFITGYISTLSQAVMMVSSYEPFFRPLLNLYSGEDTPHTLNSFEDTLEHPIRAAIFQARKTDWSDASEIAATLKLGTKLQLVTTDFALEKSLVARIIEKASSTDLSLSDSVLAELSAYKDGSTSELSHIAKLFLSLSYYTSHNETGFLIDGALLRDLDRLDLRTIFGAAGDKPIIVVYRSVPRRLVLPPRFQLLSRSPSNFKLICHANEFATQRDKIIEMMQAMPVKFETSDIELDSTNDIIV